MAKRALCMLLSILLLIILVRPVYGSYYVFVNGTVTDKAGGLPVAYATVIVEEHDIFMLTDHMGKYEFWLWGGRDYTLTVEKPGYESLSKSVSALQRGTYVLDLEMESVLEIEELLTFEQDISDTSYWASTGVGIERLIKSSQAGDKKAIELRASSSSSAPCSFNYALADNPYDVTNYDGIVIEYYAESSPSEDLWVVIETMNGGLWYSSLGTVTGHRTVTIFFKDMVRHQQSKVNHIQLYLSEIKGFRIVPVADSSGQDSVIYIIDVSFFKADA